MREDLLAQERRWIRSLFRLAAIAVVCLVIAVAGLRYAALRQAILLPPAEATELGASLNETTCASSRCHPALDAAPVTSRHADIACVTCHSQRRSHAARCVTCHDQVRHHTLEATSVKLAREEMATVREEMERRHAAALEDTAGESALAFPEPVSCVTCHLQMQARPVTFPQVDPAVHLPLNKSIDDCVDCHRAHDPRPLLGHPVPTDECQRGRDCCMGCHRFEEGLALSEPTGASGSVRQEVAELDLTWADESFQEAVVSEFGAAAISTPRVPDGHGHGTVECIACHGIPPSFHDLATRVHGFELDTVRCGKCHTGSTIIDQQVLLSRMGATAHTDPAEHGAH